MTTVDLAISCVECKYDLRATPADGACPECGSDVARSEAFWQWTRQPHAVRWFRRVKLGLVLVFLSTALLPLIPFADFIREFCRRTLGMDLMTGYLVNELTCVLLALLATVGAWCITQPARGGAVPWLGRAIRVLVFLLFVSPVLAHASHGRSGQDLFGYDAYVLLGTLSAIGGFIVFLIVAGLIAWQLRRVAAAVHATSITVGLRWIAWGWTLGPASLIAMFGMWYVFENMSNPRYYGQLLVLPYLTILAILVCAAVWGLVVIAQLIYFINRLEHPTDPAVG